MSFPSSFFLVVREWEPWQNTVFAELLERQRSDLHQKVQPAGLAVVLDHLPVDHLGDADVLEPDGLARWRYAEQLALVRSGEDPMAGNSVALRQLLLNLSSKIGDRFPYRRPETPKVLHSRMHLECLFATSNQRLDHADDDFAWTRNLLVHRTTPRIGDRDWCNDFMKQPISSRP